MGTNFFLTLAVGLLLAFSAHALSPDTVNVPRGGGGIPPQPRIWCMDDDLKQSPPGSGHWNSLQFAANDSLLPAPFNVSGLDATGLFFFANVSERGKVLQWEPHDEDVFENAYVYARYVSYRPGRAFPKYYDNIIPAALGAPSRFLPSEKIEWQETCFDVSKSSEYRTIFVDEQGPEDILILDKLYYVTLPPGTSIKCSREHVEEMRQLCGYQPDPPTSTELPPTSSTDQSSTLEPSTEPPTPSEPFVQCLDDFSTDWPSDWTKSLDSTICGGYNCLPAPFNRYATDAEGLLYFKNLGRDANAGISWPKYGNGNRTEYVFVRFLSYRPRAYYKAWYDYVFPTSNFQILKESRSISWWNEICISLDHTSPEQQRKLVVDYMEDGSDEALILDQLIYLSLPPGETINCSLYERQEIQAFCDDSHITSSTPVTSPSTESTWSETMSTPTWQPSTENPTNPPIPQEWVDDYSDLVNAGWSYSASLRSAYDTSDLPSAINQNLTKATGLLYFQGGNQEDSTQEISRPKYSDDTGDSYLFIRYYIHHKSESDTQQYFVLPVADKVMGVHYLDTTSNYKWKEAMLHLDNEDSNVSFRIGTTSDDDQNIFVIDRIIFIHRRSNE